MRKLQASEQVSLDFARYMVEQNDEMIYADQTGKPAEVDLQRKIQNYKVVTFVQNQLVRHKEQFELYSKDREDKLILIVGEKIQEDRAKDRLIDTIQIAEELKGPVLTFEKFKRAFELSRITLREDTLECTFIHLLKLSNGILEISKSEFIKFVNQSKEKAFTYTMSGMTFPNEADLFEFSDSEPDGINQGVDLNNDPVPMAGTTKSDPFDKKG